jgi:hypothetical protein
MRINVQILVVFAIVVLSLTAIALYIGVEKEAKEVQYKETMPSEAISVPIEAHNLDVLHDPFTSSEIPDFIDSSTLELIKVKDCKRLRDYNKFIDSVTTLNKTSNNFVIRKVRTTIEGDPIVSWIIRNNEELVYIVDATRDKFAGYQKYFRENVKGIRDRRLSFRKCPEDELRVLELETRDGMIRHW